MVGYITDIGVVEDRLSPRPQNARDLDEIRPYNGWRYMNKRVVGKYEINLIGTKMR